VNRRLREEARSATSETKLEQVASLLASVDDFGWRDALAAEDECVRGLWGRLRTAWKRGQGGEEG
jgi:hypothetical protein